MGPMFLHLACQDGRRAPRTGLRGWQRGQLPRVPRCKGPQW